MAVIGLEFVWRHKAPVQMSLTCCLLPLWSSRNWAGEERPSCQAVALLRGSPVPHHSRLPAHDHTCSWSHQLRANSAMSWHRAGGMGSLGLSKECRSLSDALDRGQGSMGWAGGGCQVSRLSRRQLLPCSAGRIPSGFLLFPAFPMGLSVGKVQSCPYNELSALWQLYSGWTGLSASEHFQAKSVSNWGWSESDCENKSTLFWGLFWKWLCL